MSDLMNQTFDMEKLYSKYKGFLAPAARIKIGDSGKDLQKSLHAQFEGLSVTLSSETASSVSFQIINAYDAKKRTFDSGIMKELALGNLLKVLLGYGSDLEHIFWGYIYAVRAEFSDTVVLSVTAMDVRRSMQDMVRRKKEWKGTTYSSVLQSLMEPYKKLYSGLKVDATQDKAFSSIMQDENDLDFARRLAREGNRDFFVCGDKVYFQQKVKKEEILTLSWGRDLISFAKESIYANQKVTVTGVIKDGKETVSATESVKTEKNVKNTMSEGASVQAIDAPAADSQQKAKEKAARKAEQLLRKKQSGRGVCIGIPQLVPGRMVKLDGMSNDINGKYIIRSVSHSFGSDGFQTSFEVGGYG